MKIVALISGGKDSCYNMMQCVSEGHDIVALANLKPKDCDELDSYMYQTVGHHAINLYAEAMGLPLYRRTITGQSKQLEKDYQPTIGDEVEDLYELLKLVKTEVDIEGVSVGAILSNYQRVRVENVCQRLGLTSVAYLWRRDQEELLQEMIDCQVEAIIIKVAALGLDPYKHLGKTLAEIYPHMLKMKDQFGLNICGEGGEFETFTCDCPLFNKKIIIDDVERVIHSYDPFAPVGYLNIKQMHLQDKNLEETNLKTRLVNLPLMRGCDIYKTILTDTKHCDNNNGDNLIIDTPPPLTEDLEVHYKRSGDWFYISNIISTNTEGTSIDHQTQTVVDKLKEVLSNLNVCIKNLVAVRLYVRNMSDFNRINLIYKTLFDINPPIRVCVEVSLPSNVNIQLECIGNINDKSTLHVQTISHWASANIGPYSQATQVDNIVYIAGQIGLCPASMVIIDGGIVPQSQLSLRHTSRILTVVSPGSTLNNVLLCICYVTNPVNISTARQEWNKQLKMLEITEYGDQDDISNKPNSLIQFIVVPTLPRQALVEWQVYSTTNNIPLFEMSRNKIDGEYKVSIQVICSSDNQHNTFTSKSSLESIHTPPVRPNSKDVVRLLLQEYDQMLIQLKLDWTTVPLLQIFFSISQFDYQQLYNDIYICIKTITDVAPVFSLLPVLELESKSQLLSICH